MFERLKRYFVNSEIKNSKEIENVNQAAADAEPEKKAQSGFINAEKGEENPQAVIDNISDESIEELDPEIREKLKSMRGAISQKASQAKVMGQKAVHWIGREKWQALAGFAAGAAVRSAASRGVKTAVHAGLGWGSVGTAAAAGAVVGAGMEAGRTYLQERKRLKNIDTYLETLRQVQADGVSDIDKVQAFVAVQEALHKHQLEKQALEHAEFQTLYQTMAAEVGSRSWANKEGAAKLEALLNVRVGAAEDLRSKAEKKEHSKQVYELLKKYNLSKNKKQIAIAALRGAVVGGVGGAIGGIIVEKLQGAGILVPETRMGAVGGAKDLNTAAVAAAVENKDSAAQQIDIQRKVGKTVWHSVEAYFKERGVPAEKINNQLINEGMKLVAAENGIEISGHHNIADFPGFHHVHGDKIVDIHMQGNETLHHMEVLNKLVGEAGGSVEGITPENLSPVPPAPLEHGGEVTDTLKDAVKQKKTSQALPLWIYATSVGAGAAASGGLAYLIYKRGNRNKEPIHMGLNENEVQPSSAFIEPTLTQVGPIEQNPPAPEPPQTPEPAPIPQTQNTASIDNASHPSKKEKKLTENEIWDKQFETVSAKIHENLAEATKVFSLPVEDVTKEKLTEALNIFASSLILLETLPAIPAGYRRGKNLYDRLHDALEANKKQADELLGLKIKQEAQASQAPEPALSPEAQAWQQDFLAGQKEIDYELGIAKICLKKSPDAITVDEIEVALQAVNNANNTLAKFANIPAGYADGLSVYKAKQEEINELTNRVYTLKGTVEAKEKGTTWLSKLDAFINKLVEDIKPLGELYTKDAKEITDDEFTEALAILKSAREQLNQLKPIPTGIAEAEEKFNNVGNFLTATEGEIKDKIAEKKAGTAATSNASSGPVSPDKKDNTETPYDKVAEVMVPLYEKLMTKINPGAHEPLTDAEYTETHEILNEIENKLADLIINNPGLTAQDSKDLREEFADAGQRLQKRISESQAMVREHNEQVMAKAEKIIELAELELAVPNEVFSNEELKTLREQIDSAMLVLQEVATPLFIQALDKQKVLDRDAELRQRIEAVRTALHDKKQENLKEILGIPGTFWDGLSQEKKNLAKIAIKTGIITAHEIHNNQNKPTQKLNTWFLVFQPQDSGPLSAMFKFGQDFQVKKKIMAALGKANEKQRMDLLAGQFKLILKQVEDKEATQDQLNSLMDQLRKIHPDFDKAEQQARLEMGQPVAASAQVEEPAPDEQQKAADTTLQPTPPAPIAETVETNASVLPKGVKEKAWKNIIDKVLPTAVQAGIFTGNELQKLVKYVESQDYSLNEIVYRADPSTADDLTSALTMLEVKVKKIKSKGGDKAEKLSIIENIQNALRDLNPNAYEVAKKNI